MLSVKEANVLNVMYLLLHCVDADDIVQSSTDLLLSFCER